MLDLHPYDSKILHIRKLTGLPLSGLFPWECQWLLNKIARCGGDVLEIGTYKGATAREIATAFPDVRLFCVDVAMPWYGLKPEEVGHEAKKFPNVHLTIQDSKTYAYPPNLGLIFIDGDHSWEGIRIDTERALSYFLDRTGTIVWHDYDATHECMPYLDWIARVNHLEIKHVQCTQLAFLDIK